MIRFLRSVRRRLRPHRPKARQALDGLESSTHPGEPQQASEGQRPIPSDQTIEQTSLQALIDQANALTQPQDMPQKVDLLHEIMRRIDEGEGDRLLWAQMSVQLGIVRILDSQGDAEENLRLAIEDLEAAARVMTWEDHPYEWAKIQLYLGNAHADQYAGNHAVNQEFAIAHYQAALRVFSRADYPEDWAKIQANLGIRFIERFEGDRAENLERAKERLEAALEVFTFDADPWEWARVLNIMSNLYHERIFGNRGENLERAIDCAKDALRVRTYDAESYAKSYSWALSQAHLGNAYRDRVIGNRRENIDLALACYHDADRVLAREVYPYLWAELRYNLGKAYGVRVAESRQENLEQAITCIQDALTFLTRDTHPYEHLVTLDTLARAQEGLGRWPEAHETRQAMLAVNREIVATATSTQNRAATLTLGEELDAYLGAAGAMLRLAEPSLNEVARVLEEGKAQNLRAALDLEAIDLDLLAASRPHEDLEAAVAACDAWREAQRAMRDPLPAGLTPPETLAVVKRRQSTLHQAYTAILQAIDDPRQPESLASLTTRPSMDQIARAVTTSDEALVYVAAGEEAGLAIIVTRDGQGAPDVRFHPLPALTAQAVTDLWQTQATHLVPSESASVERSDVSGGFGQAQMRWAWGNLLSWGASAYVALAKLPAGSGFAVALARTRANWEAAPEQLAWLETPFAHMSDAARERLEQDFTTALLRLELERCLPTLANLGLADLAARLHAMGIHRVALVPYGRLALFPLPAVPVTIDGVARRLGEWMDVTLAPSARAFQVARDHADKAEKLRRLPATSGGRPAVLAVGNPLPLPWGMRAPHDYERELPYAAAEANGIERIALGLGYAPEAIVSLRNDQATRDKVLAGLSRAWYVHLALHFQFNPTDPRASHLTLAGHKSEPVEQRTISLGECLDGAIDFIGVRLLVLSACETAVQEARQAMNEAIGLPATFVQAGVAAVVAALWPVDDCATFLLMSRFAQLWLDPRRAWTPARCLAKAQQWLREEATNAVILDYLPDVPLALAHDAEDTESHLLREDAQAREQREIEVSRRRSQHYSQVSAWDQLRLEAMRGDPRALPYAHPDYWAAFTVTGW